MRGDLELLAPVGSFESLVAAVQNGANAVYLGGKEFSARASADNFDRDELKEAVKYCHVRDVKVFVTVNTIVKEDEVERFVDYAKFLYFASVDALILQDIGMARLIHRIMPDFELHASTQMTAHSLADVEYLERLGFKRVVLSRELDIDEIRDIAKKTYADIEVFVHGALCVSYSGQCLMSSMLGTRSGNRGRCAQPCRQKYKIKNVDTGEYVSTDGEYLLSPRDLMTIENIGDIIDTDVLSLKIEGRMKRPEYVASVVSSYRRAIDKYKKMYYKMGDDLEREINIVDKNLKSDIDDMYTIFNRRFTGGYILKRVGDDNMNRQKPANQGLYIGNVVSFDKGKKKLKIKLLKELKKGDALNIGGGNIGRIIHSNGKIDEKGLAGETVEIDFVNSIKRNTKIYKTSDKDLLNRMKATYENKKEFKKFSVEAYVELIEGKPMVMKLFDDRDNEVSVKGDIIVEKAIKTPLDVERVAQQVSKINDTPFTMAYVDINMGENIILPIKEINRLRRMCIEKLYEKRTILYDRLYKVQDVDLNNYREVEYLNDDDEYIEEEDLLLYTDKNNIMDNNKNSLSVSVKNISQLKAIVDKDFENIYYRDINTLIPAIKMCNKHDKTIFYDFPRIVRNREDSIYDKILKYEYEGKLDRLDGFRVSTYGQIQFVTSHFEKRFRASQWFNTMNNFSKKVFLREEFECVATSQEASINVIRDMKYNSDIEYKVYGNVEIMISEYCPMGVLTKNCKKNKRDSHCSKCEYALVSSDGREFRLSQDLNCRTTIHSDETINLLDDIDRLKSCGVKNFYIDLDFEDGDEAEEVVDAFCGFINGVKTDLNIKDKSRIYTSGYMYKEID